MSCSKKMLSSALKLIKKRRQSPSLKRLQKICCKMKSEEEKSMRSLWRFLLAANFHLKNIFKLNKVGEDKNEFILKGIYVIT